MELLQNDIVMSRKYADYDGFIVFEKVKYGVYSVRSGDRAGKVFIDHDHLVGSVKWE